MKMKNRFYYIMIATLVLYLSGIHSLIAQDTITCKVLMPEISGIYKGECKKGLANGIGEATGKDFYSGEFRNGLPHGKGKYIWANGENYQGEWKKGKMNGFGEMKRKIAGPDSLTSGYWIDNEYIGKKKDIYTLNQKGTNIANVTFVRLNNEKNGIEISYFKNGKPIPAYSFGISERVGSYGNIVKSDFTKTLISVTFPFTAEISGGAYVFDFSIYQRGYWRIAVNVTDK